MAYLIDDLPELTFIPCPICEGEGGFDGDDTDPGGVCMACNGCGNVEVCAGCGVVPTVRNGLDYCQCAVEVELGRAA